jgi:hypothetical protein
MVRNCFTGWHLLLAADGSARGRPRRHACPSPNVDPGCAGSVAFRLTRGTFVMDKFVAKANIEHYRRKMAQETDETKTASPGAPVG